MSVTTSIKKHKSSNGTKIQKTHALEVSEIVRRIVVSIFVGVVAPLVLVSRRAALAVLLVHHVARVVSLVFQERVSSGALRGRRKDGHPRPGRRVRVWHSSRRGRCRWRATGWMSGGWHGRGSSGGRSVTRGRWGRARWGAWGACAHSTFATIAQR